jgi:hypothetical protein
VCGVLCGSFCGDSGALLSVSGGPPEVIHFQPTPEQQEFYNAAFDPRQERYERTAREAAERLHIREQVAGFVTQFNLGNAHVLEVGSGEGSLQDMVVDYNRPRYLRDRQAEVP